MKSSAAQNYKRMIQFQRNTKIHIVNLNGCWDSLRKHTQNNIETLNKIICVYLCLYML